MSDAPIIWTGDPDDDCRANCGDYIAHAESLDDNAWYCDVFRAPWTPNSSDERYVFHSEDSDIMPKTGEAARHLCELIIRAARAGIFIGEPAILKKLREKK